MYDDIVASSFKDNAKLVVFNFEDILDLWLDITQYLNSPLIVSKVANVILLL